MAPAVDVDSFGLTDRGLQRSENQDQFLVADLMKSLVFLQTSLPQADSSRAFGRSQGRLLAVADGMGGPGGGALASAVAVGTMADYVLDVMPWFFGLDQSRPEELRHELEAAMGRCQSRVRSAGRASGQAGLGTTLTMAYVLWPRAWLVHVGDTRCYLQRAGTLLQVTRDQSLAERLVQGAVLSPEEAQRSAFKDVLWSALGEADELAPVVYRLDLAAGDTLLLCTDGLTKHVDDARIGALLAGAASAEAASHALVDEAKAGGGSDNVTVVVARFS